jgi:class 3 adenylate cyclase/tetratricopeptide (TPR) repeat protein
LPAERRLVTALFCDLVGSTALGEAHDPEVLQPALRAYFDAVSAVVTRHGGKVEKFIGDAVAAVFGVPEAHEDDALRAVRAAAEILENIRELGEASSLPIECRLGVSTGEVLASGDEGLLVGDAMNTAARLQSAASPGSVLIGGSTYRLVRHAVVAEAVEPIVAKGKAEPVAAYRLVEVIEGIGGLARRLDSPFIGRERHVSLLASALVEAVSGDAPVLVTVLGDPGIGKSRLIDAFLRDLPEATVLRASVPAAGEGASLAPLADLVRAATGGGDAVDAAERLAPLLAGRPDAGALEAALRSLLGLGDQSVAENAWAIRRLLETLATEQPVVVALDDVQWASTALIDLVEDAARWTRGPTLLLCAARLDLLDARRSWGGGMQRVLTITVGPLDAHESRALADALLGPDGVEAERLIATAEGNPLFLEQLVVESSELGDAWDPSAAPTTIRALLESRLDRCSPEVARALEVASVQGSRFQVDIVKALIPEGVDLQDVLREAERAQLAREVEPNVGAFAHALVRETAYHRLPKATRADLHAAIADLLSDDEDELAGVHLERAAELLAELGHADPELEARAGERLARTGARAFARLDMATASDLLERAARLLPLGSAARLEMLPDFAIALMEAGRAGDAESLLERALEEADETGSRRDAIRIRLQQLALFAWDGASEDGIRGAIAEGRALLAELEEVGDDVGLAQGWTVVEYLHVLIGEVGMHADAQARSFTHAERAGRLREQVQAGGDQACAIIRGPCSVAEMLRHAARMRASANPIIVAGGLALSAAAAALSADTHGYEEAEGEWRRAIEAGGLEWPGADQALAGLAPVLLASGSPEAAEGMAREGIDVMERLGDVWVVNDWGWLLPLALAQQGRADEAAVLADAHAERYRPMGLEGRIYRGVALSGALASRHRRAESLELATETAATARTTDSNLLRTLAFEHLAGLLHDTDPAAAIAILEEAAKIHQAVGNVVGTERAARTLDTWRPGSPGA